MWKLTWTHPNGLFGSELYEYNEMEFVYKQQYLYERDGCYVEIEYVPVSS